MSKDLMPKLLICFILGYLASRMMGNGFSVGGQYKNKCKGKTLSLVNNCRGINKDVCNDTYIMNPIIDTAQYIMYPDKMEFIQCNYNESDNRCKNDIKCEANSNKKKDCINPKHDPYNNCKTCLTKSKYWTYPDCKKKDCINPKHDPYNNCKTCLTKSKYWTYPDCKRNIFLRSYKYSKNELLEIIKMHIIMLMDME